MLLVHCFCIQAVFSLLGVTAGLIEWSHEVMSWELLFQAVNEVLTLDLHLVIVPVIVFGGSTSKHFEER